MVPVPSGVEPLSHSSSSSTAAALQQLYNSPLSLSLCLFAAAVCSTCVQHLSATAFCISSLLQPSASALCSKYICYITYIFNAIFNVKYYLYDIICYISNYHIITNIA